MIKCKICESPNITNIYTLDSLPIFQNKVFEKQDQAQTQKTGIITLVRCSNCGFVFNATFDNNLMRYDTSYQNEQNYSAEFIAHLENVSDFLEKQGYKEKTIIEIGCGKGSFLELLKGKGFLNVTGFDPAYEGDNADIIKDYFGEKYKSLNADLIILRHVLEHIERPYHFLQMIKEITDIDSQVLIEVPDFNWIRLNNAFWDIYYEHCNYFDFDFLRALFSDSIMKSVFSGQYMFILANLKTLKVPDMKNQSSELLFENKLKSIKNFLTLKQPVVIWGGSSKGVTLLNLLDPHRKYVKYVVDINPVKQNKFIAITGHKIFSPDSLLLSKSEETVIVTNENYFDEIISDFKDKRNIKFYSLEKIN